MDLTSGTTHIFSCPLCGVDSPHTVYGQRGERLAIVCTNCRNGSLVTADELRLYQARWEDELREILANLDNNLE